MIWPTLVLDPEYIYSVVFSLGPVFASTKAGAEIEVIVVVVSTWVLLEEVIDFG